MPAYNQRLAGIGVDCFTGLILRITKALQHSAITPDDESALRNNM